MMHVRLERFYSGLESTIGNLTIDRKWGCFILEDQFQTEKVWGETRIPAGSYYLGFNRNDAPNSFHTRYGKRFPEMHRGMIEVLAVPKFTGILLHIGNTDDDTAGCLLTGNGAILSDGEFSVTSSTLAYRRVYPVIAAALDRGEDALLDVIDHDRN